MSIGELSITRVFSSRYSVEKCTFSPSGHLLATCFGDFSVRVFTIEEDDHAPSSDISLKLRGIIREHGSNVWCVSFSEDSALLCTCSSDKTARIWDAQTLKQKYVFSAHTATVWCCKFAPLGSIVATGSSDKTVKLWKWESGDVICDLNDYEDAIDCLDFATTHKDGQMLLCTGCRDGTIRVWNIDSSMDQSSGCKDTPTCFLVYKSCGAMIGFCKFIRNGGDDKEVSSELSEGDLLQSCNDLLVAGGENNTVIVWSMSSLYDALDHQADTTNQTTVSTEDFSESLNDNHEGKTTSQTAFAGSSLHEPMQQPNTNIGSEVNESLDEECSNDDAEPDDDQQDDDINSQHDSDGVINIQLPEYFLEPKWVLKGHTNFVWDCCSMQKVKADNDPSQINATVGKSVLTTCSGDRTLRLWDLEDGCCLKVVELSEEDKESQILTCSFCHNQGLLAVGLYNGTLLIGFVQ